MSQNGVKVMPNINEHSTKLLNLTVLQRIDPFVEEILITAAHVTFYHFNVLLSQWSRKDVEGSLFVVKRNTQPRFQFIVMNRRSTENLVENLLGDFEFEVQIPYLLYRNAAQEVNGIWFYDARECEEVANLFSRILNAYSKVPQKSKVSSTKSEYEELEAVPNLAVLDGPLEPSSLAVSNNVGDAPGDLSFVNFFSAAMTIGNTPNAPIIGQPYHSSSTMSSSSVSTRAASPTVSTLHIPSLSASTPLLHHHDAPEPSNNRYQTTNLVKPSSFFAPPASSAVMMIPSGSSAVMMIPSGSSSTTPTAPPLNHAISVQRSYGNGAPLLQPLPPPTPPPSLTPSSPSPNYGPVITREKVREALVVLVQDNQFIDMVYRALLNSHQS